MLILTFSVLYVGVYVFQNIFLKKSFETEYISLKGTHIEYGKLERCNYNIFNPEFVRVMEYKDTNEKDMYFYRPAHLFSQSNDEWKNSYTGGTTIKNTTFNELVEMAKDDCYQFQQGHGDYYGEDLAWSYSPYEPEPEKTEVDIIRQQISDMLREEYIQSEIDAGRREPRPTTAEEGFRRLGYSEEEAKKAAKEMENMPVLKLD